jgi:hypothetical protein
VVDEPVDHGSRDEFVAENLAPEKGLLDVTISDVRS